MLLRSILIQWLQFTLNFWSREPSMAFHNLFRYVISIVASQIIHATIILNHFQVHIRAAEPQNFVRWFRIFYLGYVVVENVMSNLLIKILWIETFDVNVLNKFTMANFSHIWNKKLTA